MASITRGKGEGSLFRVPADTSEPLKYWQAVVELPSRNGTRRRKFVRSKDKRVALQRLQDLQRDLAAVGDLPTASQPLETWIRYWFREIHSKKVAPKTIASYRTSIEQYIIPAIGKTRLDKLTTQHVRKVEQYIADLGLGGATAQAAHRALSLALRDAMREGRVMRNVATLVDQPKKKPVQLQVLTAADGINILKAVANDRLGSRYAAALLTGARQGELLGLEIDRVTDVLDLSWQLQRFRWSHGCTPSEGDSPTCGRKQGAGCPSRHLEAPIDREYRHVTGGLWLSRPKSSAGWRIIPLVDPLRSIIERRMEAARNEPNPHGLVWTTPTGAPIDPRDDNHAWHAALSRAGVPDARLHDARHAFVDMLYAAEVKEQTITEIVGHSTVAMTRRYKSRSNQLQLREALTQATKALIAAE